MSATFVVLSAARVPDDARVALTSSAEALGHAEPPAFITVAETDDLALRVHELDPWTVVAIDDDSIAALQRAFPKEAAALAPDNPVDVRGYCLVAVPGFAACLDDQPAKRVAWGRLQAAQHPPIPY